jgi:hypothetical protein
MGLINSDSFTDKVFGAGFGSLDFAEVYLRSGLIDKNQPGGFGQDVLK